MIERAGKKPLRTRAIFYLFKKAGIEDGEIPPRWATCLFLAFHPSRIIWRIRAQYYDFMSDTFTIEGLRIARHVFRRIKNMQKPSPWFRVVEIKDGRVTVEQLTPELPRDILTNDGTVHNIINGGGSVEHCVIALVKQKEELLSKLFRLELIAPKKIRMADGKVMMWRCPDDLVPFDDIRSVEPGRQS